MGKHWKKAVLVLIGVMSLCACKAETEGFSVTQEALTKETATQEASAEAVPAEFAWNPEEMKELPEIHSMQELNQLKGDSITYKIVYKSDDCYVHGHLSIPRVFLEKEGEYPCIIYNRGGNRKFGANRANEIASYAEKMQMIVFASQYRGFTDYAKEEFGGDDVHDVTKLIDICEQLTFVNPDRLYMIGASRGGMMTYMACRNEPRIKKAAVFCGVADMRLGWEFREDMHKLLREFIGGSPDELPEEYEKRSAVCWADEISCPVLISHSTQDSRSPYEEAVKMAEAMEEAGKEYKFVTYEDDLHTIHEEDWPLVVEWFSE